MKHYFRQNLERFLPEHAVRRSGGLWSWLPWSANSKSSPEARLIEQFKVRTHTDTTLHAEIVSIE